MSSPAPTLPPPAPACFLASVLTELKMGRTEKYYKKRSQRRTRSEANVLPYSTVKNSLLSH
jgi:hypothetical protein